MVCGGRGMGYEWIGSSHTSLLMSCTLATCRPTGLSNVSIENLYFDFYGSVQSAVSVANRSSAL